MLTTLDSGEAKSLEAAPIAEGFAKLAAAIARPVSARSVPDRSALWPAASWTVAPFKLMR